MRPADVTRMARVVREIVEERERQVVVEGHTAAKDDDYPLGELRFLAAAYLFAAEGTAHRAATLYPFAERLAWLKKRLEAPPRANLISAAALIVAEIERLDRAAAPAADDTPEGTVLADLKVGDVLVADARFACIDAGDQVIVDATEHGDKFVTCRDGMHLLAGQVDAFGRLRGFSLVPAGDGA